MTEHKPPVTLETLLRRLSPEELAQVELLTDEEVDRALAQGRAERERAEKLMR